MTFEEIYSAYWQKVFRLCMGYVNERHWAKDLAQETFITVWQKLPTFRNESSIGTWVFRIASNHCLRQIEQQHRMPRSSMPEDLEDVPHPTTDRAMEFLFACISKLPETDRIIISLELEDIRQADIADIVGISEGTVRVRIHRIKEKLTRMFDHFER